MRFPSRLVVVAVAAIGVVACSPETVTAPGVPGAGAQAAIVGISRDSSGNYTIQLQMTNADTALISVGPSCYGHVETRSNGGDWVSLGRGSCQPYAVGVYPGKHIVFPVRGSFSFAVGAEVRVVAEWDYFSGSKENETTTAPFPVN